MVVGGGECIGEGGGDMWKSGGVCGRVVGMCGRVVGYVGGWYRPMAKDCVGTLRNTAAVTSVLLPPSPPLPSPPSLPYSHSLQGVLPHAESSAGRSGADGCPQLRRDTHEGLTAAQQGAYMYCTYPLDEHIRTYAHQVGSLSGGGPRSLTCPSQPFLPPPHTFLPTSLALHTPPPPPPILIPILTHPSLPSPPPPQVFLQHLSPLLKLGNFQELWLGILGVLEFSSTVSSRTLTHW